MAIQFRLNPHPGYILLDDLLSPDLLEEVRTLCANTKLLDPKYTGAASDLNGNHLKKNLGSFVDNNLLNKMMSHVIRSLGDESTIELLKPHPYFYSIFKRGQNNQSDASGYYASFLISVYDNKDHYGSHRDRSRVTMLYWLDEEDADFTGGDLILSDYDERIEYKHNRMVIFQGVLSHEVTPLSGHGRIAITTFLADTSEKIAVESMEAIARTEADGHDEVEWKQEGSTGEVVV